MPIEQQVSDITVGVLADGPMKCKVSVRGGKSVVLTFARDGRAWEVAFSPRAVRQLVEIVQDAAGVLLKERG